MKSNFSIKANLFNQYFYKLLVIVVLIFIVSNINAQNTDCTQTQSVIFKGTFYVDGSMIPGGIPVSVEGTDIKGETDSKGVFELILPTSIMEKDSITLLIDFVPKNPIVHTIRTSQIKEIEPNAIYLIPIPRRMEIITFGED